MWEVPFEGQAAHQPQMKWSWRAMTSDQRGGSMHTTMSIK